MYLNTQQIPGLNICKLDSRFDNEIMIRKLAKKSYTTKKIRIENHRGPTLHQDFSKYSFDKKSIVYRFVNSYFVIMTISLIICVTTEVLTTGPAFWCPGVIASSIVIVTLVTISNLIYSQSLRVSQYTSQYFDHSTTQQYK